MSAKGRFFCLVVTISLTINCYCFDVTGLILDSNFRKINTTTTVATITTTAAPTTTTITSRPNETDQTKSTLFNINGSGTIAPPPIIFEQVKNDTYIRIQQEQERTRKAQLDQLEAMLEASQNMRKKIQENKLELMKDNTKHLSKIGQVDMNWNRPKVNVEKIQEQMFQNSRKDNLDPFNLFFNEFNRRVNRTYAEQNNRQAIIPVTKKPNKDFFSFFGF